MAPTPKTTLQKWSLWIALNASILAFFGYAFVAPASTIKSNLLPGETTHGHYQIELNCNACHGEIFQDEQHSSDNVLQDACIRCHGDQMKEYDTHPAKKFNDPANAELLEMLNAQECVTCHREHEPEQTLSMGLTMPSDYCWHCHQDVGESRPSHSGMKFDSCATAGCHNFHDNRAIYEKYLFDHYGEPDFTEAALLPSRNFADQWARSHPSALPIAASQADAPESQEIAEDILNDWSETAHAAAGVNCSGCHMVDLKNGEPIAWSDGVSMDACQTCHDKQVESFGKGKHGMRLAAGMSPMQPSMARLPMHAGAAHLELTCNACHSGHRFDTQYAAVTACQTCHADSHSVAYADSSHAALWQQELDGELPAGSGVTCATCHLPRLSDGDDVWVNHDQNSVLRPNETMARQVCGNCHGLEYALSALADPNLSVTCYDRPPENLTESVQMAFDYFEERRIKREQRDAKRRKK